MQDTGMTVCKMVVCKKTWHILQGTDMAVYKNDSLQDVDMNAVSKNIIDNHKGLRMHELQEKRDGN